MLTTLRPTSILTILLTACLMLCGISITAASAQAKSVDRAAYTKVEQSAREAVGTPYQLGAPRAFSCAVGVAKPMTVDTGTYVRWVFCNALGVALPASTAALATSSLMQTVQTARAGDILLCKVGVGYGLAAIQLTRGRVAYAGSPAKIGASAGFRRICAKVLIRRLA